MANPLKTTILKKYLILDDRYLYAGISKIRFPFIDENQKITMARYHLYKEEKKLMLYRYWYKLDERTVRYMKRVKITGK